MSGDAEEDSDTGLAPTALIVGCGYLGRRLAERLVAAGSTVYGTTRNPDKGRALREVGAHPLIVHVTQPLTLAALRPALEAGPLDVYYLVPPGRPNANPSPRQVVLGGIAHTAKALKSARVRRAVLVSSTAVHGVQDGRWIDADTPARPVDDRGRLLLEGENLWLESGAAFHVLRLAGLYGPGRVIGQRAIREGAPLVGKPRAMLNLIHVDDAADLLVAMMRAQGPARVELGADGSPVERWSYYSDLAQRLGAEPPRIIEDAEAAAQYGLSTERLTRAPSKSLDPGPTMRRTGWRPRYASYAEGLDALIG